MPNLMIRDDGVYGDQGFKVPALRVLRPVFEQIWITSTRGNAKEALENTGLVDGFVELPPDYTDWQGHDQDFFLRNATHGIDFEAYMKTEGCIPGRLNFHKPGDKLSQKSVEWKRSVNKGKNYFDEMSKWLGVKEAVGMRPATEITRVEREILRTFRADYGIPENAFMLQWQFSGSMGAKRIPFFDEIIQQGIMEKYPFVYVIGTGDLKSEVRWDAEAHGGRFINLYDLYDFREVYMLTSIMDLLISMNTGIFIFSQCFPRVPKILTACHVYGHNIVCGDETTVVQSKAECAPCFDILQDCRHDGDNPWWYCAGKIKPKQVIAAIDKVVKQWLDRQ